MIEHPTTSSTSLFIFYAQPPQSKPATITTLEATHHHRFSPSPATSFALTLNTKNFNHSCFVLFGIEKSHSIFDPLETKDQTTTNHANSSAKKRTQLRHKKDQHFPNISTSAYTVLILHFVSVNGSARWSNIQADGSWHVTIAYEWQASERK